MFKNFLNKINTTVITKILKNFVRMVSAFLFIMGFTLCVNKGIDLMNRPNTVVFFFGLTIISTSFFLLLIGINIFIDSMDKKN